MPSAYVPLVFFLLSCHAEGSSTVWDCGGTAGTQLRHKAAQLVSEAEAEAEVVSFLQIQKRLWTAEPRNKTRILLHHIWKNGGTHLCELARSSGFAVPSHARCYKETKDSRGQKVDYPCATGPGLANSSFDVLGHECPLSLDEIDEAERYGFRVVEVLRDPIQQAVSWYLHVSEFRSRQNRSSKLKFKEWAEEDNKKYFGHFTPNLQTRWLGGENCQIAPQEAGCIENALKTLSRMAAVLEQDGSQLRGIDRLAKLGWYPKVEGSNHSSRTNSYIAQMSAEEKSWLLDAQSIDIQLIKAARARGLM